MTEKNFTKEISREWMRERMDVVEGMVQEKLGDDYETRTRIIPKNNGTAYCIEIRKKPEMVSALVHIENCPKLYGDRQIADWVVKSYQSGNQKGRFMPEPGKIQDNLKENILEHVFPVLVGAEGNEEFIRGKAHLPFLDMEILFDISIGKEGEEFYSAKVTDIMLNMVGMTVEELLVAAMEKLSYQIYDIVDLIGALVLPPTVRSTGQSDMPMLVLSNDNGFCGASVLLKKEALQEAAGMLGGDVLILPSSVHEIICLPYAEEIVAWCWKTVKEVNESMVKPEEQLTNSVYRYNLRTDTLGIAGDWKQHCVPALENVNEDCIGRDKE